MIDLAVVVVTWNSSAEIEAALSSLLADVRHAGLTSRVLVVDSASSDDTLVRVRAGFPAVELTGLGENVGFVRANNHALRSLGFGQGGTDQPLPRAVYLLNPDTVTPPGVTRALFDALLSDARLGLVGPQLVYPDGQFQHGAFTFPGLRQLWAEFFPTPGRWLDGRFNGRYPRAQYAAGRPFPVDFVLGAAMMMRREALQTVGLLDEDFFMYCEEVDWAWRAHKAGWRAACVPAAQVVHIGGASSRQVRPRTVERLWTSRLRLFCKHYPAWKQTAARLLVRAGMLRLSARTNDAETRAAYAAVQALARRP
jgi:hypothetical protein